MEICISRYNSCFPQHFATVTASSLKELSFSSGEISVDKTVPYFPGRSDEKIMREDVKASIITVKQMLEGLSPEFIQDMNLFVANGVFIEDTSKHLQRIAEVYLQADAIHSEYEKIKNLYQATPPLIALQTLTNSSMSFIAQYAGIKGNNTTFGNTSHSGFYAVQKAISSIEKDVREDSMGEKGKSLVCASNCGGVHSFLTFATFFDDTQNWKESAAVACLLFEKNNSAKNSFGRITKMKNKNIPSLNGKQHELSWKELLDDADATDVIFSGAFTEKMYLTELEHCQSFGKNFFSFFPEFGNLGSANILFSICKGIELLKISDRKKIDIFDRDPYGRECYLRMEK
jgi:enamine deaminase RidA (YjgF/YER057c/UK114 family)